MKKFRLFWLNGKTSVHLFENEGVLKSELYSPLWKRKFSEGSQGIISVGYSISAIDCLCFWGDITESDIKDKYIYEKKEGWKRIKTN